jgi:hypothetical protein
MSSQSRPRFDAAQQSDLEAVLFEYLSRPNKIAYGEKIDDSKVDKNELRKHFPLFVQLKTLQENMAFAPLVMKNSLCSVAEKNKAKWKLDSSDITSFTTKVGARIRTMCRHLSQACSRAKPPAWASEFMELCGAEDEGEESAEDEGEESEEEEDEEAEEEEAEDFVFGWDSEMNLAWRLKPGEPPSKKEYSKSIVVKPNSKPEAYATWGKFQARSHP